MQSGGLANAVGGLAVALSQLALAGCRRRSSDARLATIGRAADQQGHVLGASLLAYEGDSLVTNLSTQHQVRELGIPLLEPSIAQPFDIEGAQRRAAERVGFV